MIAVIDPMAFQGLEEVILIELQNNRMKTIQFEFLNSLRELGLSNNSIERVFNASNLRSLELLDMSHNQIKTLSSDDLQYLSKGDLSVDFSYNKIDNVILDNTEEHMKFNVILNNNPMICDCFILNFVRYLRKEKHRNDSYNFKVENLVCSKPKNMENRFVSQVDPVELVCLINKKPCPKNCQCIVRPENGQLEIECDATASLKQIPSAFNIQQTEHSKKPTITCKEIKSLFVTGIKSLDAEVLFHVTNLTKLNLSANNLTTCPKGLLRNQVKLIEFDLSANQITQFDDEFFGSTKALRTLKLSYNKLTNISK